MARSFDYVNDVIIWAFNLAKEEYKKSNNVSIRYGLTEMERTAFIEVTWEYFLHHTHIVSEAGVLNLIEVKNKYPDFSDDSIIFFAKYRCFIARIFNTATGISVARRYSMLTIQELLEAISKLSMTDEFENELPELRETISDRVDTEFNEYYEEKRYNNYMP